MYTAALLAVHQWGKLGFWAPWAGHPSWGLAQRRGDSSTQLLFKKNILWGTEPCCWVLGLWNCSAALGSGVGANITLGQSYPQRCTAFLRRFGIWWLGSTMRNQELKGCVSTILCSSIRCKVELLHRLSELHWNVASQQNLDCSG